MSQTALELAREVFVFEGLSPAQHRSLASRYGSRLGGRHDGNGFAIAILHAPRAEFREIDTRGWEYSVDLEWFRDGFRLEGLRVRANADFAGRSATITTCVEDEAELWGVVENVLRPLLAAVLLDRGGLLIHSAAVDGLLFPGPSGSGKSTMARLGVDAGLPVITDDLNAIVRSGDGFTLLPLPFTGDLLEEETSAEPAPLRAMLSLEKGATESVRDLPLAEAVALLVRCSPYVNLDPHRTTVLLDRAAEMAAGVRRGALTFRRDGNPWPILRSWA